MGKDARPLLTSIRPDLRNGAPVILIFCEACGTIKIYNATELNPFPDTGYWTECRACWQWRFFYRIQDSRVASQKKGSYGAHHHHSHHSR
jgi:hypothetical protein